MNTIKYIWFDANRIYVKTDDEKTFSRPLEAFPLLKDASDKERLDFKIGKFGDDVRWESLDEGTTGSTCRWHSKCSLASSTPRAFA